MPESPLILAVSRLKSSLPRLQEPASPVPLPLRESESVNILTRIPGRGEARIMLSHTCLIVFGVEIIIFEAVIFAFVVQLYPIILGFKASEVVDERGDF
jgi:hypothetical protein